LHSSICVAFATAVESRFYSCMVRGKDCLYAAILVWCCISLLAPLVLESFVWTIYDDSGIQTKPCITVNREILVMVLFWLILAPKYEVPKLNTPKYVTLQKLTAKIEHCLNIFLYLYSLICTFLSDFFPK
jgi:hypothetical protein